MARKGGSCEINDKGEKTKVKATKEYGAKERRDKKLKERAALAKKQAAATKNKTGSEVSDA